MIDTSVIIPTYNDWRRLSLCLDALSKQSYSKERFEIIVVNNNPNDCAPEGYKFPENCILLLEHKAGSYAARNTGINAAKGDIIAMIDSDCIPISEWIENGVKNIDEKKADLLGGKVTFKLSSENYASEIYDSMTNMQMKHSIENVGVAKTANLFARKAVFDKIGLFPSGLKSGGDVVWTARAKNAGYSLIYSPETEVFHPARKIRELLQKQFRVGTGQIAVWQNRGRTNFQIFLRLFSSFRPPRLKKIRKLIQERGGNAYLDSLWSIWIIAWLCEIATNFGRISSYIKGK